MTKQFRSLHVDVLEQAIKTVIHDVRIPKTLRTALEVYQRQWPKVNKTEIALVRCGQTEVACLPEIVHSSDVEPPRSRNSRADKDSFLLSCERSVIEQGLRIIMQYDKRSLKWSVDINGLSHDNVTRHDMESLVEAMVIDAGTKLMKEASRRPQ